MTHQGAPVGVSMGDPAGIGPEIILKAWSAHNGDTPAFFAIGNAEAFRALTSAIPVQTISSPDQAHAVFKTALPVLETGTALGTSFRPGTPDTGHAAAVQAAIETGVRLCLDRQASALVTAPIAKSVLYDAGFDFPGHTEYLAALTAGAPVTGPRGPAMMLSGGGLRVVLTSIHEPLLTAVFNLDPARIDHIVRLTHTALKHDFGIQEPRIAMAGLNPHAGEAGALGREEIDVIAPAIARLRADGVRITDPLPPDTMFHAEARAGYDAAICHYHDQGLIPVKTLDFHGGVNITLGLPIVRTSPDHGTAFDIAGQDKARPDSLLAALDQARHIANNRHG